MQFGVLIVDDSLTVRKDLERALLADGYAVTLCATLGAARQALAVSPFSLVILDVLLPDGDGIEFLREIKSDPATHELPVMLLTTETQVGDRVRGLKIGAGDYIGKPYDSHYVMGRARELIQAGRPDLPFDNVPRILLIDDSVTYREECKLALESAGYAVLTADSGEEGLQIALRRHPSMLIVDGQLPGIEGAALIRRIRMDSALRKLPCLLLTGSSGFANEVTALDAGADAFITKDAEFSVILARVSALLRSAETAAPLAALPSSLGPKKILAIDDSQTYLQILSEELRQEGYDVVQATSGEEALELLAVQPVDAVLLDLNMPGLSGQDTCRRIKRSPAWRDIPLIILTAMSESESMIAGINAGADDYISKSGDFEVLKARLRAQLRRKQFEDENRKIRDQLLRKEVEATEARAARQLAETRAVLLKQLEAQNKEIEAFSYAVSHDLRAPLRAVSGYSDILLSDYAQNLEGKPRGYLEKIGRAAKNMGRLIDDLLALSQITRREFQRAPVDLSALVRSIADTLAQASPHRQVEMVIAEGRTTGADAALVRVALENLLGNAWKYTSKHPTARIEFGSLQQDGQTVYFVRDDGAGFEMTYVNKLFQAFHRLHGEHEFEGTGIGLATVRRVIDRHGGRIWTDAAVEKGATFFFTLEPGRAGPPPGAADPAQEASARVAATKPLTASPPSPPPA